VDRRVSELMGVLGGDRAGVRFVRAPGRVNLIGDHTDYNDGFCLPMAIDRDCVVAARPRSDDRIRASSLDAEGRVDLVAAGGSASAGPAWGRFVAAAAQVVSARGTPAGGADLAVASTVPIGSGLSSSAALCVALVLALGADGDGDDDDTNGRATALAAREVEVLATGVPVGLMDQLASVLGRPDAALLIDCRSLEVQPVPLPATASVGVVHSGLARTLASSAYAERRAACAAVARSLGVPALRDATRAQVEHDPIARHVVSENTRVVDAAAALRRGDVETLGALMSASHASLRDDFRVSTAELDLLVDLLVDAGAVGARLTGAGFGGCVVAVTAPGDRDEVLARACAGYRSRTGLEPRPFPARAVGGAGPLPRG
jgi:galactokinase